jgi:hypothetical protein
MAALIVDGDISSSGGVVVNAGGTLGGTGTVSGTITDGGTLAPGHDNGHGMLTGTLNVNANLPFNTGSTYLVQVTSTAFTSTNVKGGANLSNATVQANISPGSNITKKYNILTADGGLTDNLQSWGQDQPVVDVQVLPEL